MLVYQRVQGTEQPARAEVTQPFGGLNFTRPTEELGAPAYRKFDMEVIAILIAIWRFP